MPRQPILASRRIDAPPEQVVGFLADLENHARLAPGSVSMLSLERGPGRADFAIVELRGPLGIRRMARTELVPTIEPGAIVGRALVGDRTVASVAWRTRADRDGSVVTLSTTVERASPLDALVLGLGGRRWLERRFAAALDCLAREIEAVVSRPVAAVVSGV